MKRIIWLASYPKSGNTWTRAFLTNLLRPKEDPANINEMIGGPIASARHLIEDELQIETSDLTMDELEEYRPFVYRSFAAGLGSSHFMKIHDAYTYTVSGEPLVPEDVSYGAVYLVRNPLDVAVSFAHHNNVEIDQMIACMRGPRYAFCSDKMGINQQVKQKLLTWGEHVKSWRDQDKIPVLMLRYEDLKADPLHFFSELIKFSGHNYTSGQIQAAIDKCAFDKLKEQEAKGGFKERNRKSESFFRKGTTGSWREKLTGAQAKQLIEDHKEMMLELGYLDKETLEPVY